MAQCGSFQRRGSEHFDANVGVAYRLPSANFARLAQFDMAVNGYLASSHQCLARTAAVTYANKFK